MRRRLGRRFAGCAPVEIDQPRQRPVVLTDRAAGAQEGAVVDGQCFRRTSEPARQVPQEQPAHLGAHQADGAARDDDRVAAGREAFRRARRRLARDDIEAIRRNVELLAQPASGFTATGVVAGDGRVREVDAIVCATGFETIEPLARVDIRGSGGGTLGAAWRDGPEAGKPTQIVVAKSRYHSEIGRPGMVEGIWNEETGRYTITDDGGMDKAT